MPGPIVGDDGLARCPWAAGHPVNREYHDTEWGRPIQGEAAHLERLTLEAFQSGLAWITILRKRPAFRAAFANFDPEVVAAFDDDDVARLMADAGIVRNRAKIESTIANGRALRDLHASGRTLDQVLWSHAPDRSTHERPASWADVPAQTPESRALAKELKLLGFRFVGRRVHEHADTAHALLGAGDERRRDGHAAEQRDELPPLHTAPWSRDGIVPV